MFQNMRKHLEFNVIENCSHFSHGDNILLFDLNNLAELSVLQLEKKETEATHWILTTINP